ncbi:hypothetical protein ACLOJK_035288 [Asimina triloba]
MLMMRLKDKVTQLEEDLVGSKLESRRNLAADKQTFKQFLTEVINPGNCRAINPFCPSANALGGHRTEQLIFFSETRSSTASQGTRSSKPPNHSVFLAHELRTALQAQGCLLTVFFARPIASLSAGPAGFNVLKSYAQMGFVFSELEMTKATNEFKDPDNSNEECEEVWHGDEPKLQRSAQADRVQTTVLDEEENNDRLGNDSPQGEVTTDYSSEREEGEITVLLGKKKMYDTDGERQSTAAKVTKSNVYEEKLVTSTQLEWTLREFVVILDLCLP